MHAKIYKNTNLEHTFVSSSMKKRQANPLKSLKMIKNYDRNIKGVNRKGLGSPW